MQELIEQAIELKVKTQIGGDDYKGISPQKGNPGDFFIITKKGNQYILPKELVDEIREINNSSSTTLPPATDTK